MTLNLKAIEYMLIGFFSNLRAICSLQDKGFSYCGSIQKNYLGSETKIYFDKLCLGDHYYKSVSKFGNFLITVRKEKSNSGKEKTVTIISNLHYGSESE
jgi:hypothetical protein